MALRTFSQIVQSLQDFIRLRQPALDTKAGTVSRDLFIDNTADQLASIYRDLQLVQKSQSILNSTGKILDQFGSNYDITRDTGKRASGNGILTFNSILNNISIKSGATITAKTGVVFRITSNIFISAATKGVYSSFASSIASQLNIAGISDQYAVQVPIEAINVGANGNIPVYSLISTSIPGITNVTNIAPISGGTNPQGDPQYRNQILAGLTGSAAGTARGYQNALLAVSGIQSVFVAIPGSPILTRDGTTTERQPDGSLIVLSTGTGGKVDIWIQGTNLINITESYVFNDVSGTGDVTSPLNAHILGQTNSTTSLLTSLERRQLFTKTGQLPLQPIDSIISLSGSVSGSNFIENVNYTINKDTNPDTENTAFALDSLIFLQNFISIAGENIAKGNINSVDSLVFTGIKSVNNVHQSIIVTNDLASLSSADHTKIVLPHAPLDTVLRATNLTTGERYIIVDQNINSSTGLNTLGEITISGSILPSSQDLIQVDYVWDFNYDNNTDYFAANDNQFVSSGVDWGKSNYINMENPLLIRNGNRYNLGLSRNVDRVFTAFYCDTQIATVEQADLSTQSQAIRSLRQITISLGLGPVLFFVLPGINLITSGVSIGDIIHITSDTAPSSRNGVYTIAAIIDQSVLQIQPVSPVLIAESGNANVEIRSSNNISVIIANTSIIGFNTTSENISNIINVVSVKSQITGLELFATEHSGTFSGNVIYLATDVEQPSIGESVIVYFNSHEIYNVVKNNGTITNNTLVLSTDDVLDFNSVRQPLDDIFNGISVKLILVDYIATEIDVVARTAIALMPYISSSSTFSDKNGNPIVSRQPVEFNTDLTISRSGPAYLSFTIDNAFNSGGTFAVKGTGWFKINASVLVSQENTAGLFDLANIITSNLGTISTSYSVVKLANASINNGISSLDLLIRGYGINNNTYDEGKAYAHPSINVTSIDLSTIFIQNSLSLLTVGSTLNLTFYVSALNTSETIQFTNGRGTLYSKYKYIRIDRIDLISGFVNPSSLVVTGNLQVSRLAQPTSSSTYLVDYNYFAPVVGERLSVSYRYNNIIADATNAIENVRTLTADVLTRLSLQIVVNVSATVILNSQVINQQAQIIDQVTSAVNNLITTQVQGSVLDYSAVLRVITAINGVSGADITVLDYVGSDFNGTANRKSLTADANQYFIVGSINVIIGSR